MAKIDDLRMAMLTAVSPAEIFEAETKARAHVSAHPEDRAALRWAFERLAMIRAREPGGNE